MPRTVIISLEGNIGAGKSTLLKRIEDALREFSVTSDNRERLEKLPNSADRKDIKFIPEPVDEWETIQDNNHHTILTHFYADPSNYAFPIQIMAYATQFNLLRSAVKQQPPIIITERSLESNHEIFTKMLHNDGFMNDIEYQVYQLNAHTMTQELGVPEVNFAHRSNDVNTGLSNQDIPQVTDAVIYLRTTPETCMNRIHKRNRQGEQQITIDYLQKCHDRHENWLNQLPSERCLVLDADQDITFYQLGEIVDFVYSTSIRINGVPHSVKNLDGVDADEIHRADIFGW
jgi:deoxyadenosine/deoxycytidine kinase